jgi:hypothetical protein
MVDTERNRAAYVELVEVLNGRRALAFAGTGAVSSLGYPTWDGLISRLATEVRAIQGEQVQSSGQSITVDQVLREFKDRPLVQAQILKENLGEQYFPLMTTLFGPIQRTVGTIADLVALPFKHLLTSNYDISLELHHSPANRPPSICLNHPAAAEFITNFTDDNYERRIVHVHGRYDEPEHIILTEEDYGRYVQSAVFQEFWHVVPAASRFVFFGFGFQDFDLLYTFRRRIMALGANQHGNRRHFAIMPLSDPASDGAVTVRMRMQYGIEPVFFLHSGQSFQEYDDLLSTLKADVVGNVPIQIGAESARERPAAVQALETIQPHPEQAAAPDAIQHSVERLREISRANITARKTGDLQ